MRTSGNCKEQEETTTAYVHAHQQQQSAYSKSSVNTRAVQNDHQDIINNHNSGEDIINQIIYPYQCQISEDHNLMEEQHAPPPIKYGTNGSLKEHHSAANTAALAPPPFYNNTSGTTSSFSSSYNTFHCKFFLFDSVPWTIINYLPLLCIAQPLSQQLSTPALVTPKNNSKKTVFTTNFHADIDIPPSTIVDSNGRSISSAPTTINITRPFKKYKNFTIVDNEDHINNSSSSDMSQQQQQQSTHELPKRYICTVCGKKFVRPSSLTTHTYSHTGEVRP